MTELTETTNLIVVPSTGEVINIEDREQMEMAAAKYPEALAELLDVVDNAIRTAQDNRAYIAGFLMDRMDHDATQTLHAGDYTITVNGSSDEYESYDVDELRHGLQKMVDDGALSESGASKAVRVKYEVSKSGINSLRALRDEKIDQIIDRATSIAIRRRRVTIKRR